MTAEFVRRAERGLGVAIREGQDRGEVIAKGKNLHPETIARLEVDDIDFKAPRPVTDFAPKHELSGITGEGGIYAMTDGVSDERFAEALAEARDEGNLSRANVARRCRDCGAELDRRHVWRCAACLARRIERGGAR